MAKALLGYLGGSDPQLLAEVARLRRRLTDLEADVLRLRAENDRLSAAVNEQRVLSMVDAKEPALA